MFEPRLFDSLVPGLESSPCYSLFVIHLKIPFFFNSSFDLSLTATGCDTTRTGAHNMFWTRPDPVGQGAQKTRKGPEKKLGTAVGRARSCRGLVRVTVLQPAWVMSHMRVVDPGRG